LDHNVNITPLISTGEKEGKTEGNTCGYTFLCRALWEEDRKRVTKKERAIRGEGKRIATEHRVGYTKKR